MNLNDDDNIPLLDDLIEKGQQIETLKTPETPTYDNLEEQISNVLQRHTSQAVAEIMALIESQQNKTD